MRLGISEKTVEKHIAKGMRLLADALFSGDDADASASIEAAAFDAQRRQD